MVLILKCGFGSIVFQSKNLSRVWTGGIVFPFGVWSLWLWRNKVVFRDTSAQRPLKSDTIAKATEFALFGVNGKVKRLVRFGGTLLRWIGTSWIQMALH